ncbi:MAG TPA: hypothetical protein VIH05_02160 [Tepidiformaceae bacterium]
MTSPEDLEGMRQALPDERVVPPPVPPERREEGGGFGPLEWAKALVMGVRDTAHDIVDEGREGAREAYDDGWRRYAAKTRRRRR